MLVDDDKHQVQNNEYEYQGWEQQNVQRVEATHDVSTRELASEEQERNPRSDHWYGVDHSINDAQTVPRKQVVGE